MRRTLWGLAAIVAIGMIIVLIVPLFVSSEDVRGKLFAEIEDATGYRLRVDGPVDISMFPFLDLVAEDVGVSGRTADGFREFATAEKLRFGLSLAGLISGNVKMTEIALVRPVITVPGPGVTDDTGADTAPPTASSPADALRGLSIDRLTITDGTVVLPGTAGKPGQRLEDVTLTASLSSFDDPLTLDLEMTVDGQPVHLNGSVAAFGPFLQGSESLVSLQLEAPDHLAKAVGLAGTARYSSEALTLEQASIKAGDSALTGAVSVDLGAEIPHIWISLAGDALDLDSMLANARTASSAAAASGADSGAIDFAPLRGVVADLDISLDQLIVAGLTIEPLVGTAQVADGKLDAVADLIGMGQASGSASVSLDATRDSPYVTGSVRISGVDLATAGRLAATDLPVTGTAGIDVAFATAGRNLAEWKNRINATGSVTLADGSLAGIGVGDLIGDPKADRLEAINVTAKFDDLIKPVSLAGNAVWHGERFEISATGDVRGFLADKASAVEARATATRVSAGFRGTVSPQGRGSGRVSLETPSLTGLLRWLGQDPGWQSGFEAFAVDGELTVRDSAIAFSDATIRLDETRGTGSGRVSFGGKPRIEARLDLETLDLNPYLGAAAGGSAGGGAGPAGWSDQPIDLSILNALDAKLSLSTKALIYKNIQTGPVGMSADIAGGKLTADLPDLKLYGGTGTGHLAVDANARPPTQGFRFALRDLSAYPFLKDAAAFERIEGTGYLTIDLTGSGASQRAIVSSLTGTAQFEFADGAIRGLNVAKMARSLTSGTLSGWQSGAAEKTDFAELGADFTLEDGKAVTDNLNLTGPLVRVAGAGVVSLPARTLNFRIDPKVVASLEGQGGKSDLEGLGVPVIIAGTWSEPLIYPDIAGILKDPAAAYEQLRALGGGLFKLPAANPVAGVADAVKNKTGIALDQIVKDGKIDTGALQNEALKGINQLLQGQTAPAPAEADPVQTGTISADAADASEDGKRRKKDREEQPQAAEPPAAAETDPTLDAAQQLLQGLFGKKP